jgi:thermitase
MVKSAVPIRTPFISDCIVIIPGHYQSGLGMGNGVNGTEYGKFGATIQGGAGMKKGPSFGFLMAVFSLAALAASSVYGSGNGVGRHAVASIVASNIAPGEILVKFKDGTPDDKKKAAHQKNGGKLKGTILGIEVEVVEVQIGQEAKKANDYASNPNVSFAEVNGLYYAILTSNDPQVGQQWQYNNTGQTGGTAGADIHAFSAWDVTMGSAAVAVAILDTGIDQSHEDLASSKITKNVNFTSSPTVDDKHGHGTHVAGSAAASTNNSIGVAGTCPMCALYNVKVLDDTGSGSWSWVANGITWAADNGAKVISMSLGDSTGSMTVESAVNYAWSKGVVLTVAAGNSGTSAPTYPAYYTNVIAVAATDNKDVKASFSNYGSWVDVAAPGAAILSTAPDHANNIWGSGVKYGTISGTSMATPHVAGVAGLVWSTSLCAANDNTCVRNRVETRADPIAGTGTSWTYGRINAYNSVTVDTTAPTLSNIATSNITPSSADVTWNTNESSDSKVEYDTTSATYINSVSDGNLVASHKVSLSNLQASTTYYYRVTSVDTAVNKAVSGEQSFTTPNVTPATFGENYTGTLVVGTVAYYTFSGTTGDSVYIRLARAASSPSLSPEIKVYRPDGTLLCSGWAAYFADKVCSLDATGAYTVLAFDHYGSGSGAYGLFIQRTSSPINATAATFGGNYTGTLVAGTVEDYTFSGTAGDSVYVRYAKAATSASLSPEIKVYRPNGALLCSGWATYFADTVCSLDATGAYTIVTFAHYGYGSGAYGLYVQRTSSPINATAATFGENYTGTLVAGTVEDYTFSGTAGESVYVRYAKAASSASLSPEIKVYRPNGALLCSGWATYFADTVCSLDATGAYTIVTFAHYGYGSGAYGLYVQRTSSPINASPATFGENYTGTLVAGTVEDYTFSGTAGESVYVRRARASSSTSQTPEIKVYRPNGTLLCSGWAANFADTSCSLDATGAYTVVTFDHNGYGSGAYGLYVQRTSSPINATALVYGTTLTASLGAGVVDDYIFSGTSGEKAYVKLAEKSTSLAPEFKVYRPNGTLLCSIWSSTTAETTCTLDSSGIHTVLVFDHLGYTSGSYELSLCQSSCAPPG